MEIEEFNLPVDYHWDKQFESYTTGLNFIQINKLTQKYFSPSDQIEARVNFFEKKYKLDYQNICVLFFRGNDKITETPLPTYSEYIARARDILKTEPSMKFLIQSDDSYFINAMKTCFPDNHICFDDEIIHMAKKDEAPWRLGSNWFHDHFLKTSPDHLDYSKTYLAITIVMSRCQHVICNSGNCSVWIVQYRGNSDRVQQFLNGNWPH
jgi:hypothetical protein